jgi:hypothetical protein
VRIRKLSQQQPPLLIQLSCRQGNVRQAQRRRGWLQVVVVVAAAVVVGKELELGVVAVDKVLAKVLATVESVNDIDEWLFKEISLFHCKLL